MMADENFDKYAEGFVDGSMGASRLVREVHAIEIETLKAEVKEAREIIELFAKIKPSSLYPRDGSENELYCVVLKQDYGNRGEFTGADLARARAFLKEKDNG